MPRVRYTGTSIYSLRDGPTWDDETREADVDSPATAERLAERPDFELVENGESGASDGASADTTDGSDGDGDADDADEGPAEDSETIEADPEAGAAYLADQHWQRAVSAVESGDADGYLDALESTDDRNSVQQAIDARRAELEG